MRTTQYVGLNELALAFIQENGLIEDFPSQAPPTLGMFDEEIPLRSWNNGKYIEKSYVEPWSSGPMIFTAIWNVLDSCWCSDTLWVEGTVEDFEFNRVTGRFYV